jgi:hypothetical protein
VSRSVKGPRKVAGRLVVGRVEAAEPLVAVERRADRGARPGVGKRALARVHDAKLGRRRVRPVLVGAVSVRPPRERERESPTGVAQKRPREDKSAQRRFAEPRIDRASTHAQLNTHRCGSDTHKKGARRSPMAL